MPFVEINPSAIKDNLFERIGTDWMLVCAGSMDHHNAMTASWGQTGILWNKPVATVYVRPQRYTFDFMEKDGLYTLSFFAPGERRRELELMGTKSGRDGDKIAEAGLTVAPFGPGAAPGFAEAALVLVCRPLYKQDLREDCFLDDATLQANYPGKDFHRMTIGQIDGVFVHR